MRQLLYYWGTPIVFYGACLLLSVWLFLSTFRRPRFTAIPSDAVFAALCLLLLVLGRLPSILFRISLNPDETQLIAQALTLLRDPVYWRSVDGTTIGPLNSYILCWPGLLGWPITYTTIRLTGLFLIAGTLAGLYAGLAYCLDRMVARRTVVVLLCFYSFSYHPDFLHFSSEMPAVMLLTILWWQLLKALSQSPARTANRSILAAGLLAGLIPYTKLQAVPIAAVLALFGLTILLTRRQWRQSGLFVLAGLFPNLVLVLATWLLGVVDRFWLFYIESNLFSYGEYYKDLFPLAQQPLWQKMLRLPATLVDDRLFLLYSIGVGTSLLFLLLRPNWPMTKRLLWAGTGLWFFVALFCYLKPGTFFVHHQQLLLIPMAWLLALSQDILRTRQPTSAVYLAQAATPTVLLIAFFVSQAVAYLRGSDTVNHPLRAIQTKYQPPQDPVAQAIRQYARPTDQLVVWGWKMSYHVDTQLPQGVSENHSFRSIMPHSLIAAYQRKYMEDIQRTRPALFIDATGPSSHWMIDTARFHHEQFPALGAYIRTHYKLVRQVGADRIYLRTDRVSANTTFTTEPLRPAK